VLGTSTKKTRQFRRFLDRGYPAEVSFVQRLLATYLIPIGVLLPPSRYRLTPGWIQTISMSPSTFYLGLVMVSPIGEIPGHIAWE
jgi:hypothetical protein